MEYKQVVLMRKDLKLPKGKMAAQCSHACVEAVLKSRKELVKKWRDQGQKKIILKVDNEKELYKYAQQAKGSGLVTAIITDAGRTCIAPGTVTCCGIGPDEEKKVDQVTGELGMV